MIARATLKVQEYLLNSSLVSGYARALSNSGPPDNRRSDRDCLRNRAGIGSTSGASD